MTDWLRVLCDRAETDAGVFEADEVVRWPDGRLGEWLAAGLVAEAAAARVAACDGCGIDHVEEVVRFPPGLDGRPRLYIPCPELGRVEVDPERLRRWRVDVGRLADMTATALGAAVSVDEVVPRRIWRLGWLGDRRSRQVFFARGAGRPDAPEVFRHVAPTAGEGAVVLVLGEHVEPTAWPLKDPIIRPLTFLIAWSAGGLRVDTATLGRLLDPTTSGRDVVPVAVPADLRWEEVRLRVTDHELEIGFRGGLVTRRFDRAGFADRRTGRPDRIWALLARLARSGGNLAPARDRAENAKQAVKHLNARLRALLPLRDAPVRWARADRRYELACAAGVAAGAVRPPRPRAWADVTMAAVDADSVLITVDLSRSVAVYDREDGAGTGGWEPATAEVESSRRWSYAELGLIDASGRVSAAGAALRRVLRAGGTVDAGPTHRGLLALCRRLCDVFDRPDSPFQFSAAGKKWTALFDCGPAGPRR